LIANGSIFIGLSDSTIKSANLPEQTEPLRSSSKLQ
jgi:hypothetical protein